MKIKMTDSFFRKHVQFSICLISIFFSFSLFSQESLKSTEEEYYDFLSLTGIVDRPTLGYRTLSDSVWIFNHIESFEENEDGTFTKVRIPGQESSGNIWKNNNLGSWKTLWQPENISSNFFMRGLKQGLFLKIYGPEWFNSYNSAAPYGQNDGALWQGKGYNTALTGGLRLEGYGFELTFKPQLSFSQNLEFEYLPGVCGSEYSYFTQNGGSIDLVQRYGNTSFWNYDWGDSELRWTWNTFTIGFGSQNPWLGPAWLNPMLGSNNAAGYPKFDIGLRKTQVIIPGLDWNLGYIEGRLWVGKLSQSDYFNIPSYPFDTMITAMSASYSPSFIPRLSVGLNRIFLTRWNKNNLKYSLRLFTASKANDVYGDGEDQKISIFADWYFPNAGFEIYIEYGLDDFSTYPLQNFFHTGIYTVGIKQKLPHNGELIVELNNFEMSQDFQLQWPYGGYYTHGKILTGYTNKGQSLGAGTGLFGNSQYFGYTIHYPKGNSTFFIHRFCPNNNYVYNMAVTTNASKPSSIWEIYWANFEAYISFGTDSTFYISKDFSIDLGISIIHIANNMYNRGIRTNSISFTFNTKYNF